MCLAVLFSNSKFKEQQDNKFISPEEVKLRCGIRDVNALWGPESKGYKIIWHQENKIRIIYIRTLLHWIFA